ncbi:MAG: TolC family protein [Elusimicrobia bacterium]|nr:TolC family protein [Elusimicrobiota bacterium]
MMPRLFLLVALAARCPAAETAAPAAGDLVLTEAGFLRQVLEQSPRSKLIRSKLDAAAGERRAAGLLPNPSLQLRREQVSLGGDSQSDSFLEAGFPLDVSGRRSLRRSAAQAALDSISESTRADLNRLRTDALTAFYGVLETQERQKAMGAGARRLKVLIETLRGRAAQASEYDRIRLERERAEAEAEAMLLQRELAGLKAEVARLVTWEGDPLALRVSGELPPPENPLPEPAALRSRLEARQPLLASLRKERERAAVEFRRAGRLWVPDLGLAGGLKSSKAGGQSGTGFTAGIGVVLPLFDRGLAERQIKESELSSAESALESGARDARVALEAAFVQARTSRDALSAYRTTALPQAERLEQMAGLSYLEGRLGILELIDAYRGGTSARLKELELALNARLDRIKLERVLGEPLEGEAP